MSTTTAGGTAPDMSTRVNCSMEPPMFAPAHEPVVDAETIYSLVDASVHAALATPEMRVLLMVGIDELVVASIPRHLSPRHQTFQDLAIVAAHPH